MKRLLFSMVSLVMMSAFITSAHAQTEPLDDLEAFRQMQKPPSAPAEDRPLLPAAAQSPLGLAGELPVGAASNVSNYGLPQTPEELQAVMEEQAEMQRRKIEEQTFELALKQLLPLEPQQIRRTLEEFKISREAAETPITVPEPRQVVETLALDTSATPAVIKVAPGYVTTVTIIDSTGAPWPIQDISWAGKFDMTPPEEGGHIIRIIPSSAHGVGNMSVRLVDLITPIVIQVQTGIDEVHYRFDARVPRPGPLAKTPIIEYGGLKAVAGRDDYLTGVLEGTPPAGAEKLDVKGTDGRTLAWKMDEKIYLRTPLTLLSPGWDSSVSSADGTKVYTLNKAPVILLSDNGRMVRANISAEGETP